MDNHTASFKETLSEAPLELTTWVFWFLIYFLEYGEQLMFLGGRGHVS